MKECSFSSHSISNEEEFDAAIVAGTKRGRDERVREGGRDERGREGGREDAPLHDVHFQYVLIVHIWSRISVKIQSQFHVKFIAILCQSL